MERSLLLFFILNICLSLFAETVSDLQDPRPKTQDPRPKTQELSSPISENSNEESFRLVASSPSQYQLNCPSSKHLIESSELSWGETEEVCSLNGVRDGQTVMFYSNGKIAKRGQYIKGVMVGEWVRFFENGKLLDIGYWKEGRPEGEWKFFYNNGAEREVGNFREGKKVGFWKSFNQEQKVQQEALPKLVNFKHRFGNIVEQHSLNVELLGNNEILTIQDSSQKRISFFSDSAMSIVAGWTFDYGKDWATKVNMIYKSVVYSKLVEDSDRKSEIRQSGRDQVGLWFESRYKLNGKHNFTGKLSIEERSFITDLISSSSNFYYVTIEKKIIPMVIGEWRYQLYQKGPYLLFSNAGVGMGPGKSSQFEIVKLLELAFLGSYQRDLRQRVEVGLHYTDILTRIEFKSDSFLTDNSMINFALGVNYVFDI